MTTREADGRPDHSRPLPAGPGPLTVKGIPVDPNLRIMAVATLVNTFGNGALVTTFALYFTRVVGLRPTQVGLALSAGALTGLLVQVPAGHLADLRGPRKVLQAFTFGAGIAILGLLFARSVWALVAVMAVTSVFDRGAGAVRNGYIARLAEGGQAVQFKAYLRAMTNVGISFGAMFGGGVVGGPGMGLPGGVRPGRDHLHRDLDLARPSAAHRAGSGPCVR